MPVARLSACSGSAWLRPDGDGATPTRRALLPRMEEVVRSRPIGTRAFAPPRPSAPREPSLSLERQKAVLAAIRFRSPLLGWGCLDVLAKSPHGGEEGVAEEREGYVAVPTVPAPHLVVGQAHLSLCLLEADLHPPTAAGHLRQLFERRTLGGEDRVGAEVFRVLDGAAHH